MAPEERIARLEKRLARERAAREEAERLLEERGRLLYDLNQSLEQRVEERTAELLLEKERAEEASRAKQRFLATMSHELRTPMNAVIGSVSLVLGRNRLEDEDRGILEVVRRSAEALVVIINDILDLSKLESGKLDIVPQAVRLAPFLEDCVSFVGAAYERPGVEFSLESALSAGTTAWLDPDRLRQILLNLTGNAMKFTERGSVRVVVGALGEDGFEIRVEDTGVGIPEEALGRIFEEFEQVDGSFTRKVGGTGLGLAIARRLVERMGGHLSAASRVGEGSTFSVRLPWGRTMGDPSDEAEAEPTEPEAAPAVLQPGLRVLLVEDNPVNVVVASQMLEYLGCTVTHAADGLEATEQFCPTEVDLVLMDGHMPILDGFEASRRIRASHGPGTPIIALTGNAFDTDRAAALAAGMNDHAAKPMSLEALEALLVRWDPRARPPPPAGST